MDRRLDRGQEPGPDADAARAQGQRGDEPTTVDETTGGHDGAWMDSADDLRYKHRGGDLAAITTPLAAFRDDHVDTDLGRLFRVRSTVVT